MIKSSDHKIHHEIGSLVRVVKKGETSWALQSRFLNRHGIVVGHEYINSGYDTWTMNEVMFDDGEKSSFYDVEITKVG